MQANVYQHFRKDEHPFIDMVSDWIEEVDRQYSPVVTDFLNPREAYILETLVKRNEEINYSFFGGFKGSERTCAIIYPSYYEPSDEDYEISIYNIVYPKKFGSLSHGKILGTMMSVGVKREYIGDIITDGEDWQVFIKSSVANYVTQQIDKIGSFGVHFKEIDWHNVLKPIEEWTAETVTISSLRIDNIISTVYNISRQRAKMVVESNKVKLNWVETDRVDAMVDYLDIISVRGLGRIQLLDEVGKTKKDKIRLNIRVLRK